MAGVAGLAAHGFAEVLAARAAEHPDRTAFRFARDGTGEHEELTYAELAARAAAMAAAVREAVPVGGRVLLLFPPGLDYVTAVFACFHAGAIGVSAAPPHPKRLHRTLPRLLTIAADADVDAVLTTEPIREAATALMAGGGALARAAWLTGAEAGDGAAGAEPPRPARPGDVAFLQYTSGSTSDPRGVMLTHRSLAENSAFIERAFGHGPHTHGFIWLPPYHDMGLIGGILQPVYAGFECTLTSPIAVMKRPAWWLEGVTRFAATTSGGPNFAFDLCVDRIGEADRAALDLSTWDVAFNGAEPIRASTLARFTEAFAPCGFRASAFLSCYGLAEATLMVTAVEREEPPAVTAFDADALKQGRAASAAAGAQASQLVSCGRPDAGHAVAIADPRTGKRCEPGAIGEVWVAGPSVASGYWHRPQDTAAAFAARLAGEPEAGPFLRTGDLGAVVDGELYVTGRLKDLLIIRGRNYHPHDVEEAAEAAHPLLRTHCSAAFEQPGDGDGLAIALEVDGGEDLDAGPIVGAVRERVAAQLGLQLDRVVLCRPGAVPKTTSGKIQHALCRRLLDEGEIVALAEWRRGGG